MNVKYLKIGVIISLFLAFPIFAQLNSTFPNIKLLDVNEKSAYTPNIGEKVLLIYYVDPDVYEIYTPIANEVKKKKYQSKDFQNIAIMNLKDTWVPNFLIMSELKKSQKKDPVSKILIDKNYSFAKALNISIPDDSIEIIVVGKDSKIKFINFIKSEKDAKSISNKIIEAIDSALK